MHSSSKNVLFSNSVCQITLGIKENAEVSFELWTENPDQKTGLGFVSCHFIYLNAKQNCDMLE